MVPSLCSVGKRFLILPLCTGGCGRAEKLAAPGLMMEPSHTHYRVHAVDASHMHMVLFQTAHTPNHFESDDRDVSASYSGEALFLICDASVHSIREDIDEKIYLALGTMNGDETATEF